MTGNQQQRSKQSRISAHEGENAARTKILLTTKSAAQRRAQQSTVSALSVDSSKASKSRPKNKVKGPHGPHASTGDISFRTHRSNSSNSVFESLRTCHYLLVRRTNENMGMVPQTVNSYEVCTSTADRLFYVLGSEHKKGSVLTNNGAAMVLLMLASDGVEVIRIERWDNVTSKARKLKVFKRDDLIGTVSRVQRCSWVRPYFTISDEAGTEVLRIVRAGCEDHETSNCRKKGGCCPHEDDMQVYYDIVLPGCFTKTGGLGKADRILGAQTLADLKESYGVELNGAMTYNQKSLLLASLFLVYRLDTLTILKTGAEHHPHDRISATSKSKRAFKLLPRRKSKAHFFPKK